MNSCKRIINFFHIKLAEIFSHLSPRHEYQETNKTTKEWCWSSKCQWQPVELFQNWRQALHHKRSHVSI